MKSILIRQLDVETLEGLKRRARRHRRSLQKEVEALLHDAARMTLPEAPVDDSVLGGLHTISSGKRNSSWPREALYGDDGR
jgi:plasmid stability protein